MPLSICRGSLGLRPVAKVADRPEVRDIVPDDHPKRQPLCTRLRDFAAAEDPTAVRIEQQCHHHPRMIGWIRRPSISHSAPDGFLHLPHILQALGGGRRIIVRRVGPLAGLDCLCSPILPVVAVAVGERDVRAVRMADKRRVPPSGRDVMNRIAGGCPGGAMEPMAEAGIRLFLRIMLLQHVGDERVEEIPSFP